jgi:hypothetical protein
MWAASLFGGWLWGRFRQASTQASAIQAHGQAPRVIPLTNRLLSSLALVIAGWVWLLIVRATPVAAYALFIAIGMTLGFLGDLALAGFARLPQSLLWGMGLFGVGHICYITAMLRFAGYVGLDAPGPRWSALGFWLAVGASGWFVIVQRGHPRAFVRMAALPYALLLSSLAGITTGMALQDARFAPLAFGSILFLTSDLLLAGEQFGDLRAPWVGNAIWLTYGPAQALIVYSVGSALARLR